jgi:replicative DNA helicase
MTDGSVEKGLVGLLINDPPLLHTVTVRAEWFEDSLMQMVVAELLSAKERGSHHDLVTIGEKFKDHVHEIVEWSKNAPLRLDAVPYASLLHDAYVVRKSKVEAGKILGAEEAEEVLVAHSNIEKIILDNEATRRETLEEQTQHAIDVILNTEEGVTGAPFGVLELDNLTKGGQKGDVIVCAARPGMGKTGMALNAAMASANRGRVLFFSREMPSDQLVRRMWTATGKVSMEDVFQNPKQNRDAIIDAANEIKGLSIEIIEDTPYVEDMCNIIAKESRKGDVSLVIVDYLQLCKTRRYIPSREREVSEMSWAFKQAAKNNKVPLLLLSQLSRECEKTETKVPETHHLRDSGSIEQDASVILLLYRSSEYDITDEGGQYFDMIKVAKNRNGSKANLTGQMYDGNHQTWNHHHMNKSMLKSNQDPSDTLAPF